MFILTLKIFNVIVFIIIDVSNVAVSLLDPNQPFVSQNETQNCRYQPGSLNPNDDVFHCNFTDENFDRLLENGDK